MVQYRTSGPLGFGDSDVSGLGDWLESYGTRAPAFPSGVAPEPLGRTLWQKAQPPSTSPAPETKTAKQTIMPPPADTNQVTKTVRVVDWPLFAEKGGLRYKQVKQAPRWGILNCPVAAILAAYASTPVGAKFIQSMVSEKKAPVETDLSEVPADARPNPPKDKVIHSSRYFSVKLTGGTITVSNVLYTDDADSGWSLIYMHDPSDTSIWAAVIEKALAVKLASYAAFNSTKHTANDFWEQLTGAKPDGFAVTADTPLEKIIEAAKASTQVPTIGASKESGTTKVTHHHGHAMLGMQGKNVLLYDPAKADTIALTPSEFRKDFQAIFYAK